MAAPKIRVESSDKRLRQHADAISATLADQELMAAIEQKYPGIKTLKIAKGRKFGVIGFEKGAGQLVCSVNPGSAKVTARQFSQAFVQKKKPEKKEKAKTPDPALTRPRSIRDALPLMNLPAGRQSSISDREIQRIDELINQLGARIEFTLPDPQKDQALVDRKTDWKPPSVPEQVSEDLAYGGMLNPPSIEVLQQQHDLYFSGSFVRLSGGTQLSQLGKPMHALDDVNLFTVKRTPQTLGNMIGYPFRTDPATEEVVIPIVGDFIGAGGNITEKLIQDGKIKRVTHEGNQVTTPIFVKTMRQLFQPTSGSMKLLRVRGETIIPNSEKALERAWDLANIDVVGGHTGSAKLRAMVDQTLDMAHRNQSSQEPIADFKDKFRPSMTLRVGIELLEKAMGEPQLSGPLGLDTNAVEILSKPVCGVGIKGAGCLNYDGNHIYHKSGDTLPAHIRILHDEPEKDTSFVVDQRYEGLKGLILPVAHQPWSNQPVGGTSTINKLSFDRENTLLKNGAVLSYVTTAVIPILTKADVPEMVSQDVAIVTNAIFDDSRRIDDLLDQSKPLDGCKSAYLVVACEKYSDQRPAEGQDMKDYFDKNFPDAKDKHWEIMTGNIGKNLRAMFDSNLTNPNDQNMIGNFSIDGGLADTIDLATMRHPKEFASAVLHTFSPLTDYYKVAGSKPHEFFKSKHFATLLKGAFGQDAEGINRQIQSRLRKVGADDLDVHVGVATGIVTDEFAKLAGVQEKSVWQKTDAEFLTDIQGDRPLLKEMHLAPSSLVQLKMSVTSGKPLSLVVRGTRKMIDPHLEVNRQRAFADLHLRAMAAMNMAERDQLLKQEYADKFGQAI